MPDYFFAVLGEYSRLSKKAAEKRNKLAKKVCPNAGYVYYYDPSRRKWIGYGFVPSKGCPFDEQTAKKIQEEWQKAGV